MTKTSVSLNAADRIDAAIPGASAWAPAEAMSPVKKYLQLTKPGIVFGNLISVIGGFFLASRGHFDPRLFVTVAAGVSLLVASGCAFNNYIDRDIDRKMRRTQKRVLAQALVPVGAALAFAALLGLAGLGLLYAADPLSALLGVFGFAIYVGVYSLYLKRRSVFQTVIGSLSGAMPPVIGYCAVSGRFDPGAALLLLIFSLWQMPHSHAIGIVYRDDYAAAGVPVLPVHNDIATAKKHILFYIPAFTAAALLLPLCGYAGLAYALAMGALGAAWMYAAVAGYRGADDRSWARKMFGFSILAVMLLSLMMSVDGSR